MKAERVLLDITYAGVIRLFAAKAKISAIEAADVFYNSNLFTEISNGISDMHARSEEYLAEELLCEYHKDTPIESLLPVLSVEE